MIYDYHKIIIIWHKNCFQKKVKIKVALWYFPWSTFINNIWLLSVLFGRPNLKYLHSKSYYLSKYGAFSTIQPHIS